MTIAIAMAWDMREDFGKRSRAGVVMKEEGNISKGGILRLQFPRSQ